MYSAMCFRWLRNAGVDMAQIPTDELEKGGGERPHKASLQALTASIS